MPSSDNTNRVSRRGFLIALTGSAIAAAAACRPGNPDVPTPYAPGSGLAPTATRPIPTADVSAAPDPTYGQITFDQIRLTPVESLYITQYDYNNTPEVDAQTWALTVDGLVEQPLTLNYEQALAMPVHEDTRTLECISNPVGGDLIGNLTWTGFLFQEILDRVKVKPEATHVRFEAADGYTTAVQLEWITQPGVMLAYNMNGEPLTVKHGFPLRIHMPGLYGQKMPRWLTRIEFIDYDYIGFWESRGWSNVADIRTKSIVQSPPDNARLSNGARFYLQGVAVAGKRRITAVEVRIDDGEWMPATLAHGPSPLAWTQWYVPWTFSAPGAYRVAVRATDETGFVQVNEDAGLFGGAYPSGTDAIHSLVLESA
ncbi:MAG: molybdopterin-dependent oxidoreductase [Anaerolineae bacterium]|nr:molybdopterin-dependent oxidoreductase [Anaerolineae bacterium]